MIGLLVVLFSAMCGGAIGFAAADVLKKRCSYIDRIMNILEQTRSMIRYNRMKLSEIFAVTDGERRFFVSDELIKAADSGVDFQKEWNICVDKLAYLQKEDKAPLYFLGEELGKSDADSQTAMLISAEERLSRRLETAQSEYERKGRLFRTLGILSGAAIGIIFI